MANSPLRHVSKVIFDSSKQPSKQKILLNIIPNSYTVGVFFILLEYFVTIMGFKTWMSSHAWQEAIWDRVKWGMTIKLWGMWWQVCDFNGLEETLNYRQSYCNSQILVGLLNIGLLTSTLAHVTRELFYKRNRKCNGLVGFLKWKHVSGEPCFSILVHMWQVMVGQFTIFLKFWSLIIWQGDNKSKIDKFLQNWL